MKLGVDSWNVGTGRRTSGTCERARQQALSEQDAEKSMKEVAVGSAASQQGMYGHM